MSARQTRVLYLDVDGTVRKSVDELGRFVNSADDVELFPGTAKLLAAYRAEAWRIVAITNQGGVALGHVTIEAVMIAMAETLRQAGGAFDQIMICTHHPAAADPAQARCLCRKPRIGMVVGAVQLLHQQFPEEVYPPHLALFVGDRDEDRQCAANAGIDFLEAVTWRALGTPVGVSVETRQ